MALLTPQAAPHFVQSAGLLNAEARVAQKMGHGRGARFASVSSLMCSILFCSSSDERNACCFLEVRHPVVYHNYINILLCYIM